MKKLATLYLPAQAFDEFKKLCRRNETSANKVIAEFIEKELKKGGKNVSQTQK